MRSGFTPAVDSFGVTAHAIMEPHRSSATTATESDLRFLYLQEPTSDLDGVAAFFVMRCCASSLAVAAIPTSPLSSSSKQRWEMKTDEQDQKLASSSYY
ncbi:hypothetical protein ACP70R_047842 [Stipagrostis hirtigluma subsp. patula]